MHESGSVWLFYPAKYISKISPGSHDLEAIFHFIGGIFCISIDSEKESDVKAKNLSVESSSACPEQRLMIEEKAPARRTCFRARIPTVS